MTSLSNYLNNLNTNKPNIEHWIRENKPQEEKSRKLFFDLLKKHGKQIKGDLPFSLKTAWIMQKATRLATGSTVLKDLLKQEKKSFCIQEGHSDLFRPNTYQNEGPEIHFNYKKKSGLDISVDEEGNRIFSKNTRECTLIHETLHALHHLKNINLVFEPTLPEMDSFSEEYTITGVNQNDITYVSENTARFELGLPPRINHRGADEADFRSSIACRILKEVERFSKDAHGKMEGKIPPLEFAIGYYLTPESPHAKEELTPILHTLLKDKHGSKASLTLVLLMNSVEFIKAHLEEGISLEEELFSFLTMTEEARLTLLWKKLEEFEVVTTLIKLLDKFNIPFALLPGQESPLEKEIKRLESIKKRFFETASENRSFPLETVLQIAENLDFTGKEKLLEFAESVPVKMIDKPKKQAEVSSVPVVCAEVIQEKPRPYLLLPDGSFIPSDEYTACHPWCYKRHTYNPGVDDYRNSPKFSNIERQAFLNLLSDRDLSHFATSIASDVMKSLNIGYQVLDEHQETFEGISIPLNIRKVHRDFAFEDILKNKIKERLAPSFFTLQSYQKDWNGHCIDIPLIDEKAAGILETIEECTTGKYRYPFQKLKKEKEGAPFFLRLRLASHLFSNTISLGFEFEIWSNGERSNTVFSLT